MPIHVISSEEIESIADISAYSALFVRFPYPFFAQVIGLAKKFRQAGKKVVDAAIAEGDTDHNKWEMYQNLKAHGIDIPKTELSSNFKFLNFNFQIPYIVKWIFGIKGRNVYLIENEQEFKKIESKYPVGELIAQEYIEAEYEYKVIIVGYKSLPIVLRFEINNKTKRSDFKTTEVLQLQLSPPFFKEGSLPRAEEVVGVLKQYASNPSDSLPLATFPHEREGELQRVVSLAETASKATKRELAKVDILQKGNQLYVLEVNRWPGFESFEKLSGFNVAGEFVKYLLK